jgi:hypothetical protein
MAHRGRWDCSLDMEYNLSFLLCIWESGAVLNNCTWMNWPSRSLRYNPGQVTIKRQVHGGLLFSTASLPVSCSPLSYSNQAAKCSPLTLSVVPSCTITSCSTSLTVRYWNSIVSWALNSARIIANLTPRRKREPSKGSTLGRVLKNGMASFSVSCYIHSLHFSTSFNFQFSHSAFQVLIALLPVKMRTNYYIIAFLSFIASLIAGLDFQYYFRADKATVVAENARNFLTLALVAWCFVIFCVSHPLAGSARGLIFTLPWAGRHINSHRTFIPVRGSCRPIRYSSWCAGSALVCFIRTCDGRRD